jgi:LysM repeat protein
MTMYRILVLFLLVLSIRTLAQETRTVNGRKYHVVVVEAGQTLYAISRAHAVPVDALVQANPGVEAGLRLGQELLIPTDAIAKKEAKSAPTLMKDGELRHLVAKKETLFGIAKRYNMDVNDLLARNPHLSGGLKEGMEVIVPITKVTGVSAPALRPADTRSGIDHYVQPGETLYAISKRYGIDPAAIETANNGLKEGLKAGMTLRIPKQQEATSVPQTKDSTVVRARYQVALLLPFSIQKNDSALANVDPSGADPQFYEATRIAAQFYAGARMAMDSLAKQGLQAEVTVLDVGDDQRTWAAALKDPKLAGADLCIGPFHRSAIEQIARSNSSAHIVCPVPQTAKIILGHPNVSKVAPTRSDLVKHAARYVALRHSTDNVIVLKPEIATDKEVQEQMIAALNGALTDRPGRYRDSVLVVKASRREINELISKLDKTRLNVIVAPSEDVEFVTTLVTKLKAQSEKFRIALVGMESWLSMDPVASSDLDVLGFLFATSTFADPLDPRVVEFTHDFRQRFKCDVDAYALLGFDVTYYYLSALLTQGPDFTKHYDLVRTEPLHMGFRMGRTGPENGFRNEYAVMLQQKDLRLVKAP